MTPNWKNLFCVLLLALMADACKVSITGPDTVFTGIESKFTCETTCTISWRFSGGLPSGSFSTNKGVVTWTPSKPGSQSFTCVATDATTGQSAQATKTVEVKDAPEPTPTPDPGSGAAQLTGPFAMILSLGLLMVLEI